MPEIHPTANVEAGAQIADDAVVGPYAYVGKDVVVGPATVLHQGVVIEGRTVLGRGNEVFPYAVLGTIPQDKKYQGEPSRLEIGSHNVIREHVTVNIGTDGGGGVTRIGDRNLIMVGAHVGHDCVVGSDCILANGTGLAGHVVIEDWVILGGQTGVHQFVRFGAHCMASGGSKVNKDVPPFTVVQGYPARLRGINHVGLKRRGFADDTVRAIRQAYRAVFSPDELFEEALVRVREEFQQSAEVQRFIDFLVEAQSSERGFLRPPFRGADDNGNSQAQQELDESD